MNSPKTIASLMTMCIYSYFKHYLGWKIHVIISFICSSLWTCCLFFNLFSWLDLFLWDPTLTTSRIFVHSFLLSGKFARSPPSPRAGTKTTDLERAEKTERNFSICCIDLLGWLFKLPFLSMQLFFHTFTWYYLSFTILRNEIFRECFLWSLLGLLRSK